jgi:hypothetical protein
MQINCTLNLILFSDSCKCACVCACACAAGVFQMEKERKKHTEGVSYVISLRLHSTTLAVNEIN